MRKRIRKKGKEKVKKIEFGKLDKIAVFEMNNNIEGLIKFLKDKNPRIRWHATRGILRTLVRFNELKKRVDEKLIRMLCEVLKKDEDFEVREQAAKALAYCYYSKEAEKALVEALKDEREDVVDVASQSLYFLTIKKSMENPVDKLKVNLILNILGLTNVAIPDAEIGLLMYSLIYGKLKEFCPNSLKDAKRVGFVQRIIRNVAAKENLREVAKHLVF